MKVYGPYTREDGRMHVIHYDGTNRITQSYPRYLMEQHLGRKLEEWEEVDHINGDFTYNRIDNLQILTKEQNLKKHHAENTREEVGYYICPQCRCGFYKPARQVRGNRKQGKAGPFCSKSCAGKWSTGA